MRRNAMACGVASAVYTGAAFVEALPRERLASLALDYVNAQARVDDAVGRARERQTAERSAAVAPRCWSGGDARL